VSEVCEFNKEVCAKAQTSLLHSESWPCQYTTLPTVLLHYTTAPSICQSFPFRNINVASLKLKRSSCFYLFHWSPGVSHGISKLAIKQVLWHLLVRHRQDIATSSKWNIIICSHHRGHTITRKCHTHRAIIRAKATYIFAWAYHLRIF